MIASIIIGMGIFGAINAFTGDIYVHDPSFIKSGNCWYVFCTGSEEFANGNAQIRKSCNGGDFSRIGAVFNTTPAWLQNVIHKTPPNIWAPDINYFNGQWYVYYSGSIWGTMDSAIGVATASNVEGPYTDHGEVIHSNGALHSGNISAMDPELAWSYTNEKKTDPWLVFGSFNGGIYAHKLDSKTGKFSSDDKEIYHLSSIGEASSTTYHNGHYYLFVSVGSCCKGVNSTYHVVMGRASKITGPYVDHNGKDMLSGGGTQITSNHGNVYGPGGEDVYIDGNTTRMIYHWYDGAHNGRPTMDIVDLVWSADGWPTVGSQSKLN